MKVITLILLLLSTLAVAQSVTIPVTDSSAADSPVALSGSVAFSPAHTILTASGHNKSQKEIISLIVTGTMFDGSGAGVNLRHYHEHYFNVVRRHTGNRWTEVL